MFSPDTTLFVDEGIVHEEVDHTECVDKKSVRMKLLISCDGFFMKLGEESEWYKPGHNRMGRLLAYQDCLEEIRKLRAGKESKAGHIIPPKDDGVKHEQDTPSR